GWKDELPAPFACGAGIFACQSIRQPHLAEAISQVLLMLQSHFVQMELQWRCEIDRQHRDAISSALGVAHSDASVAKVDVFDSQPNAFHQPKSTAVKESCHQPCGAVQMSENLMDFVAG